MRILHYFLGFPPYRTGGLTKFAYDLMQSQAEKGDSVIALWPGRIGFLNSSLKIKKRKSIGGIENYEIINPLPVPLDEGIRDFELFTKSANEEVYSAFLSSVKADAIHIHTLMGLHKEFIEAADKLKIKTVFTTHDYFGICPKVTLFRKGNVCDCAEECSGCAECNKNALSLKKIMIMQSPVYRFLKDSFLVKKLRQRHRQAFFEDANEGNVQESEVLSGSEEQYKALRKYYTDMLEMIDLIHFNSSVTESVYKKFINPKESVILTISNKEISNNTSLEKKSSDKIRYTFLSPAKPFKGYLCLISALDKMWDEGKRNFELNLYTNVPVVKPYMNIKGDGFTRSQLPEIFSNTDILAAPSIWYETFGFTVLEALSYGVPVIVSDRVGAKDIVGESGVVVDLNNENALYDALVNFRDIRFNPETKICYWDDYVAVNETMYH